LIEIDPSAPALTGGVDLIAPNVWRIVASNPSALTGPGTNTYIAGSGPRFVVIDPGPDDTTHIDRILAATDARISHVLCTHSHPDHSPGAAALRAWVRPDPRPQRPRRTRPVTLPGTIRLRRHSPAPPARRQ